jgi:hypothetical protein
MYNTNPLGHAEHNTRKEFISPSRHERASEMNQGGHVRPLNVSEMRDETTRDPLGILVGGNRQRLQDALPGWAAEFCGVHEGKPEGRPS